MPIYEYTCSRCKHTCELLIRGEETPVCPECGSEQLAKELSVPATPAMGSASLPTMPMGCGRPACGGGRCAMGGE